MTDAPAPEDRPAESPHTAALRKAVRFGVLALAVLAVISAIVWALVDGLPGLWGALMGAGIGGAFVLATAIVVIATARGKRHTRAAVRSLVACLRTRGVRYCCRCAKSSSIRKRRGLIRRTGTGWSS